MSVACDDSVSYHVPLRSKHLSSLVPSSLRHRNMPSAPGPRQQGRQASCPSSGLLQRDQLSYAPESYPCLLLGVGTTKLARPSHYLFSSGSDPHSTLLGFCSIHFNSIQDALQHAKRLGWAHCPPPRAHRPPTPHHPGPRAQHPWYPVSVLSLSHHALRPEGVRAGGGRGRGAAGGRARGKLGW